MSPLFRLLSSPVTAVVLGSLLLMVLAAGILVPQDADADVARAIPSAIAQVAIPLGLTDLARSWLVETLAVMLALNLVGYALSRSAAVGPIGVHDAVTPPSAMDAIAVAFTPVALPGRATALIPGVTGSVEDLIRPALPTPFLGSLRSRDPGHDVSQLHGSAGLRVEAFLVAAIGVALISFAPHLGGMSLDARLRILEGDDDVAASWARGERRQGDLWIPWKPVFSLSCSAAPDAPDLAPRACTVLIDGKPHQATLEAGRDLEFDGLRITWSGVSRTATVGGVELTLTHPSATTRGAARPGDVIDLLPPDAPKSPLASALVGTTSAGDPLGIIAGSDNATTGGPLTATVIPRRELHFWVQSTAHVIWVTGGLALVAIGLLLGVVFPTYRIDVLKRGEQVVITVDGTGLAARPARYLSRIVSRLGSRPSRPHGDPNDAGSGERVS
ncbi:MAG: hypothetical protein IV100_11960 [Myxococcales bacterium]|nr:hypothetical protein [Myxococcales bacterium]